MSGSTNMRGSNPPSGTVKSTQEQLRSDHIQSLELLQQFKNENVRLKKELAASKGNGKSTSSCESEESNDQPKEVIDVLSLMEANTKQAEEIKLLKTRINQAETELLKSRQASNNSQQAVTQLANEKLKKREAEMTQAVLELEAGLRNAQSQLLEVDFLKQQNSELQATHEELKHLYLSTEKKYQEVSDTNDRMFGDSRILQANISRLEAEVVTLLKRNNLLESVVEQKGSENKKVLADCTEQNALLRQDLVRHVENFQKLQHAYSQLSNESNTYKRTIQGLNETVEGLKQSLRETNDQSTVMFGDSDSERGETFQLTTPAPTTAGNKSELPPINTKAIAELEQQHSADPDNSFRFQEYLRLKRENKELKMRLADMGASGAGTAGSNLVHSASGTVSPKGGAGFTSPLPSARQLQSAGGSRGGTAVSNSASAGVLPAKLRNNVARIF